MDEMNIGQIAQIAGLQTSAIRYYESIGLVPLPKRASGWRRYEADVLRRLNVIKSAREVGFTLEEIRTLLDGLPLDASPSERWQRLAVRKLPEVEALIERAMLLKSMLEAGINCDCDCVEDCITSLGEACQASNRVAADSCDCDDCAD
jgi:MerR family redox-sensitive transcriptional activator SoxR